MWFGNFQYILPTFNILIYIHNVSLQSEFSDNNTIMRYQFPQSNIETINTPTIHKFPKNSRFGIAAAAYKIEKWNTTEHPIWDYVTHVQPVINQNNIDEMANSFQKYKEDIRLAKDLGFNMYRISLSWSRILPDGYSTRVNTDGIRFYNNLINEVLINGIQPIVTIFQWDLPYTLQQLGGWLNPLMVDFFKDYARIVFTAFGDKVKYWITINEPINMYTFSYTTYISALNQSGIADYLCGHNLLLAHAQIYDMYNREFRYQKGKVGITLPLAWFEPENKTSPEDIIATERAYRWFNEWFLHPLLSETGDYPKIMQNQILFNSFLQGFTHSRLPTFTYTQVLNLRRSIDFLGISYYMTRIIRTNKPDIYNISVWNDAKVAEVKHTSWGLEKLLKRLINDYIIPEIIIIENGYDYTKADMNRTTSSSSI